MPFGRVASAVAPHPSLAFAALLMESQEPSLRGRIVRSAIPASRPGRTASGPTYVGTRYSVCATASPTHIRRGFPPSSRSPMVSFHLPAPICLLGPALRCYSLPGGPTLAPERTWRQLIVLVACLLARSVSAPTHQHQGASLPRLRLARQRISGHRPHLQAEASVARRHACLPAASPPAPYQSGSALPRTTGSNRGHIFISLSSLHPTLRYL